MNDDEIEALILNEINKRGITWLDMINGRSIRYEKDHQLIFRINIFKAERWPDRLIELICDGDYDPLAKSHVVRVSIQDLMRFWWNRIICQEDLIEEILEDIFVYFKDKLCPVKAPEPVIVYDLDFSQVIPEQSKSADVAFQRKVDRFKV